MERSSEIQRNAYLARLMAKRQIFFPSDISDFPTLDMVLACMTAETPAAVAALLTPVLSSSFVPSLTNPSEQNATSVSNSCTGCKKNNTTRFVNVAPKWKSFG